MNIDENFKQYIHEYWWNYKNTYQLISVQKTVACCKVINGDTTWQVISYIYKIISFAYSWILMKHKK